MSLLDGLLGNHADQSGVASALLEHLNTSGAGGLTNLLQGFNRAGMGEKAQSWVSTTANQPVSPDQVQQGLGDGLLNSLAARAGISPTVAKVALAAALPLIVDHLTPQGNVPDQSSLAARIGGLLGRVA
jgi:uncharacterized protein YidB (DUF937 family)